MADERTDPLADLFTLFATPVSGAVRSVEQFRKGVDEFLRGVENFNRTMENLNETAERINALLGEVEEPLRAAIPQVTRTVKAADQMMQVISGPAIAVAPGLEQLASTLSNPVMHQLPNQLVQFSDVLGELSRRMGPLTTLAESAGGLFGWRSPAATRPPVADPEPPVEREPRLVTSTTTVRRSPAEKSPATKSPAKRSPAKKSSAKKSSAKKASARTSSAKRA